MVFSLLTSFRRVGLAVLAALAALSLLLSSGCGGNPVLEDTSPTPTSLPTLVQPAQATTQVQRGEVVKEIDLTGYIVAAKSQDLFFYSDGYVRSINVKRGNKVTQGQVLATLDAKDLESQLAEAQLALKTSQAQLDAAKQSNADDLAEAQVELQIEKIRLEQTKYNVRSSGSLSSTYDLQIQIQMVNLAQLKVDRLLRGVDPQISEGVEAANLTVQRLQGLLADTQVTAPFDGTVTSLTINKPGEQVSAYRTIATVGDLASLEVTANEPAVSSTDSPDTPTVLLAEGMPALIQDASQTSAPTVKGTVTRVPSQAPSETDKAVRIRIDQSLQGSGLALDSTVKVRVQAASKENVLWLPPLYVRTFEGRNFVIVVDKSGPHRVDIKTGLAGLERVEIVQGLSEGQVVQEP
jgi:multidrug efflux pump subunit AcrA (membrane-fusion protein)